MAPSIARSLAWTAAAAMVGSAAWVLQRAWKSQRRTKKVRIAGLFVYPVKSCRGHSLSRAQLTKWGLQHDRRYMIVNEKYEFVTQRELPRMVLIHPDLPTESGITLRTVALPSEELRGVAPTLFVPKLPESPGVSVTVKVWDDFVPAVDQGEEVSSWLCSFLEHKGLRLVRISDSAHRTTDPNFGTPGETGFADGFPILVTSQASVEEVDEYVQSMGGPVIRTERFRPNLHIEGCKAFEEDEIDSLEFGEGSTLKLTLIKPCARCPIPGVDPQTGIRNPSTGGALMSSLRNFRTGVGLKGNARLHQKHFSKSGNASEVFFGQNAQIQLEPGQEAFLTVGDVGTVL